MLGQAIAITVGLGLIGSIAWHERRTKPGSDWMLAAVLSSGLLFVTVLNFPSGMPAWGTSAPTTGAQVAAISASSPN